MAAVVMFGLADGAASLVGASIAVSLPGVVVLVPGALALYGVYLVVATNLAGRGLRTAHDLGRSPGHLPKLAILSALAVALSVDNLVSGAAAGGAPVVVAGATSAALMLAGLLAGGRILQGASDRRRTGWVGAGLVLTACLALVS